ncbi:MAG: DUF4864 domain-containing protein [Gammaproteobacteria bacterium]|nr:DUF4864 domain-containing protein [Gammaproteobacteria bacterium]
MFCPSCGAQIPAGAHFCPQCGANVAGMAPNASPPVQNAGGNPPPAATPAPTASGAVSAPPKKHRLRRFLMWAAVFIVAVIGLAMWATGDLVQVADDHLAALRQGDVDTAYSLTSTRFREETPLAVYKQFVASYPILTGHQTFEAGEREFSGDVGTVKGTLTGGDHGVGQVEFQMVKEGEVWRIQGFELN